MDHGRHRVVTQNVHIVSGHNHTTIDKMKMFFIHFVFPNFLHFLESKRPVQMEKQGSVPGAFEYHLVCLGERQTCFPG